MHCKKLFCEIRGLTKGVICHKIVFTVHFSKIHLAVPACCACLWNANKSTHTQPPTHAKYTLSQVQLGGIFRKLQPDWARNGNFTASEPKSSRKWFVTRLGSVGTEWQWTKQHTVQWGAENTSLLKNKGVAIEVWNVDKIIWAASNFYSLSVFWTMAARTLICNCCKEKKENGRMPTVNKDTLDLETRHMDYTGYTYVYCISEFSCTKSW